MSVYVTDSLVREAVAMVTPAIHATLKGAAKRRHGYLLISALQEGWQEIEGFEFGDRPEWELDYYKVAAAKDEISRRTGLTTREVQYMHPELLEPGDTVYYGNAKTDTIIVSFSGVEPYFDELFAKWVLAAILALIQHKLEHQRDAAVDKYY